MASLTVGGKNLGPHAFLADFRTGPSREVVPGITLADMGGKTTGNDLDNAWLHFKVWAHHLVHSTWCQQIRIVRGVLTPRGGCVATWCRTFNYPAMHSSIDSASSTATSTTSLPKRTGSDHST
jgi:hypothetical protein